jgi:DnaJ-class molecular chaperone
VAGAGTDSEDQAGKTHEPRECMACRGSGKVISNLGGGPKDVACPWCQGTGQRIPGVDAQEPWREAERAEGAREAPDPSEQR